MPFSLALSGFFLAKKFHVEIKVFAMRFQGWTSGAAFNRMLKNSPTV
jgi:hypothetical protein